MKIGATDMLPVKVTAKNGNCLIFQLQFQWALNKSLYKSYVVCGERFGHGQIRCGIYNTNKIAAETI